MHLTLVNLLGVAAMLMPYSPAAVVGAVLIAAGAFFTLRAVWQWERTRLVVTTEKVYLLNGTLHRRAKAVRLKKIEAVEIDQSLVGQLFGYGTVFVGPLKVHHIAVAAAPDSARGRDRPHARHRAVLSG